ncbi:SURF1 family cytochrome oxidase biogenesis protein [uncultured Erythrobacter sp.]|uniref:SURF1 family protein n=1 Tax=uncultured Erythrobacter sp. TaxID=263913 RepID=UPI002614C75E|nr:SURF1 family cytochrome oxidase biogenesis protein [uncultured Erythrobacter sp.]
MIRKLPVIPTVLVLAAAATMVWLGFWQLGRADEKAALIAEFEERSTDTEIHEIVGGNDRLVYRNVRLSCDQPRDWQAVAGRSDRGQSGFAHRFVCNIETLFSYDVPPAPPIVTYADIGWSNSPQQPDFNGGNVEGVLVRLGDDFKLVASEPLAGLQPLAKPDPNDLPNNHLAYAGQWFLFALTALIIYGFALRARLAKRD